MEIAVTPFNDIATDFGLMVSFLKTKFMAAGGGIFGLMVSFLKTKFMAVGGSVFADHCAPLPVACSVVHLAS